MNNLTLINVSSNLAFSTANQGSSNEPFNRHIVQPQSASNCDKTSLFLPLSACHNIDTFTLMQAHEKLSSEKPLNQSIFKRNQIFAQHPLLGCRAAHKMSFASFHTFSLSTRFVHHRTDAFFLWFKLLLLTYMRREEEKRGSKKHPSTPSGADSQPQQLLQDAVRRISLSFPMSFESLV